MRRSASYRSSIQRFFRQGFQAADIAQVLVSYDAERDAGLVRERMEELGADVAGVRDDGFVVGYVRREELADGRLSRYVHPCGAETLLESDAPLTAAISCVAEHGFALVRALGDVSGIVTRADLQKPPARMWLFGLITVIERTFTQIIQTRFKDEAWRRNLSPGRQALAAKLLAERHRRGERPDIAECLQFGDKAQVVLKERRFRDDLGIPSWTAARETIKQIERLRNALAHSQDIVGHTWPTMVRLADRLDTVLDLYDGEA